MISVIIPTYKNKRLLINNLRNNLSYLDDCQIIIVNDDPTQSIKNDLQEFEGITLIENKKNLGFGESVNQGIRYASSDYLFLLNNDVVLPNENYKLAINRFKNNPSLFAVSFAQKEKSGTIVGKNKIFWEKGFFQHKRAEDITTGENGWAEGGCSIIDKKKFLALAGFNKIYAPFYWEDIDLSYRAKKHGYQIIFDSQIEVIHHHESTIGRYFSSEKIREVAFRNQLIFNWQYLDHKKITEHLLYIIPAVVNGGWPFFFGFIKALFLLPTILFIRQRR